MRNNSLTALIDGDVLAHLACAPGRWQTKAKKLDEATYIRELDSKGNLKEFTFTREEDRKYMEQSWRNFKFKTEALMGEVFADDYLMVVGGRDNFRKDIYDEYKHNRHRNPKKDNIFVPAMRELAVFEGLAHWADNREADDYIRVWAEECRQHGRDYVICSIDKDLKCIPGKYYNIMKKTLEVISEESAMRHYYEQLLKGDPTDNIPGIPGLGPVGAQNDLADCHTEEEFREVVMMIYKAVYDSKWKDYLLSNGKCIHLQKHLNDYFNLEGWPI